MELDKNKIKIMVKGGKDIYRVLIDRSRNRTKLRRKREEEINFRINKTQNAAL